jgi:hypothetical protein
MLVFDPSPLLDFGNLISTFAPTRELGQHIHIPILWGVVAGRLHPWLVMRRLHHQQVHCAGRNRR